MTFADKQRRFHPTTTRRNAATEATRTVRSRRRRLLPRCTRQRRRPVVGPRARPSAASRPSFVCSRKRPFCIPARRSIISTLFSSNISSSSSSSNNKYSKTNRITTNKTSRDFRTRGSCGPPSRLGVRLGTTSRNTRTKASMVDDTRPGLRLISTARGTRPNTSLWLTSRVLARMCVYFLFFSIFGYSWYLMATILMCASFLQTYTEPPVASPGQVPKDDRAFDNTGFIDYEHSATLKNEYYQLEDVLEPCEPSMKNHSLY